MTKIQKERKVSKLAVGAGALGLAATGAFASGATTDSGTQSFGTLLTIFTDWFTGNLGKLLALLGFAGTFIVYMMTHKASVLFVGIIISLLAGGMIGISKTFFDAGASSFGSTTN